MSMNTEIIRKTFSLCPVCLRKIPAVLERRPAPGDEAAGPRVFMNKECPEHGCYSIPVWKDFFALENWIEREDPLEGDPSELCIGDCRRCISEGRPHGQGTCCVILEVTRDCDLHCPYCFARGGEKDDMPSFEELCAAIDDIAIKGSGPLIQLSGGEPTLRDDLPELVKHALEAGCRYTQINTNGIRLSEDEDYVRRLAEAGLDIVFLQFDGTDDEIYRKLRGRDMLDVKLKAIRSCDKYRIGVTLVPTVVRGVNDRELGNIIRKAAELFPAVRSVHFQPVTYLGRFPADSTAEDRYTLDELMADLCEQTGIPEQALLPSRCDHAMCEFHSTFMLNGRRQLVPMTDRSQDVRRQRTSAESNRQYVAEHWGRKRNCAEAEEADPLPALAADIPLVSFAREEMDFDEFVRKMRTQTVKISAMAFQDRMNIDLERLHRCSLHVYTNGQLLPFCAKYLQEDQAWVTH